MTAVTSDTAGPGRTRITSRALNRVVSAITADELGVATSKVGVELDDAGGRLVLAVRAPIHVPSIDLVMSDRRSVSSAGGTVMERAGRAQENIRTRVQELTGANIARIVLRLTGAEIHHAKRVK